MRFSLPPSTQTTPAVGRIKPAAILSSDVLPQPCAPMRIAISPESSVRFTLSTTARPVSGTDSRRRPATRASCVSVAERPRRAGSFGNRLVIPVRIRADSDMLFRNEVDGTRSAKSPDLNHHREALGRVADHASSSISHEYRRGIDGHLAKNIFVLE